MKTDWIKFVRLFSPEGVDGGGAVDAGSSGTGETGGAGGVEASDQTPAPAATFLTQETSTDQSEKTEAEVKVEEPQEETPAPVFDLASVTLPEGFTLDEELGKSFAEIISDQKLSPQERGQKFIDLHTSALKTASEAIAAQVAAANEALYKETNEKWRAQIKDLPEFKANPEAEAGKIRQALISLGGSDEFFRAMDLTGAGNNPVILQMLHRLTSPHFEGTAVGGGATPASSKRLGDNIYTSTNKP